MFDFLIVFEALVRETQCQVKKILKIVMFDDKEI